MGTCAPTKHVTKDTEEGRDTADEVPNSDRITKIINDYQADNEMLRSELEEMKSQKETAEREDKAKQNDDVIKELEKMKALMETKDRALVKGRVEAALLTKANTLLSETTTRVFIKGDLKHQVPEGSTKSKSEKNAWVEVHLTEGEIVEDDFKEGYVTLVYSDSKDAETSKKCKIVDIADGVSEKEFSVVGSEAELLFACETDEQRINWVKCINDALTAASKPPESMTEVFTLKLQFTKDKLGIRVEEEIVETTEIDVKEQVADESANEEAEQKVDDSEAKIAEVEDAKAATGDSNSEEELIDEEPCQLIVTKITDEDLSAGGLKLDCAVIAINDTSLIGKGYSEQLELLRTTPKPFTLSFRGKKIRREQTKEKTGYSSILKELVADDENSVKRAFYDLVKGTPFERELQSSDDKVATITNLLGNQRRLMALIHNFQGNQDDL